MRKTIVFGAALLLIQIPLLALVLEQERTWGGVNRDDANEVAFAPDGSVYVAGTTVSGDGGFDDEFGTGLAVAADGSVYMTGQFGTGVLFLANFSANGELLWDSTWGDNGTIGTGAAIDAQGNVYVSGLSSQANPGNDTEALLLKFSPAGDVLWATAWGGLGFDAARSV